MAESRIDYIGMLQSALRTVVRQSLERVAEEGLPGEHHFFITFATQVPGVGMPEALLARYPEEITIVLQHDYRDLEVDADGFSVTLRFGGTPNRLHVPFAALKSFFDPSVQFGLTFEPQMDAMPEADGEGAVDDEPPEDSGGDGKVVSFDAFRRR